MKLSLTNAHRIRKSLEVKSSSKVLASEIKNSVEFSVFDDNFYTLVPDRIAEGKAEYLTAVNKAVNVIAILNRLRKAISTKNKELNISDLLDSQSAVEKNIAFYVELSKSFDKVESETVVLGKLKNLKAKNEATTREYGVTTELSAVIVDEDIQKVIKDRLIEYKREQRKISDKITGLNALNHIEISDEDFDVIEKLGIV